MSRSPYKLLDFYTREDADLFFGREAEIRRMVGEILSTRLLVLFSPSGSGKTSLIQAGVRPQLENRGFQTVYTRLGDSPLASVCRAVRRDLNLPVQAGETDLYGLLGQEIPRLQKPLVIFIDQFEEFFLVFENRQKERSAFIEQVARIKYDEALPVYLVLSLREDFFARLHEFRAAIPSIFQNNANLHLEPFDEESARQVIEEPLKTVGWSIERGLTAAIIADLSRDGRGIAPITLQLVCGSLWEAAQFGGENTLTLASYHALGGAGQILDRFVSQRLEIVANKRLSLLDRVIGALKTPDNTKRFRSIEDIKEQLGIRRPPRLQSLLDDLSANGILRHEESAGTSWYEFKHDYLVKPVGDWLVQKKERQARRRFLYAILPGIVLGLGLFIYGTLQYLTFYARYADRTYDGQEREIVITRGLPLGSPPIGTGFLESDLKDSQAKDQFKSEYSLGFSNVNDWYKIAKLLEPIESAKLFYLINKKSEAKELLSECNDYRSKELLLNMFYILDGEIKLSSILQFLDIIAERKDNWNYLPKKIIEKLRRFLINLTILSMNHPSKFFRWGATQVLGYIGCGGNNEIDALIIALKDRYFNVRWSAAYYLGELSKGGDKEINALVEVIKYGDNDARNISVMALGQIGKGKPKAILTLIAALKDRNVKVRQAAAAALGRIGKEDSRAIYDLVDAMKDEDWGVRKIAVESLGRIGTGGTKVIAALLSALEDHDEYVRKATVESLGQIGTSEPKAIAALLAAMNNDQDSIVRQAAVESLGRIGKGGPKVIAALVAAMKDKSDYVRQSVAGVLGRIAIGNQKAINAIFKDKVYSNYILQTSDAYEALFKIAKENKKTINDMINYIRDQDKYIRKVAVEVLGRIGTGELKEIATLLTALKDRDEYVRQEAAESLGRIGTGRPEEIEFLLDAMKDRDSGVRTAATKALGNIGEGEPKVIASLVAAMKDEFELVRQASAEVLGRIGNVDPKTIAALLTVIKDEYQYARQAAAEALGRIGTGGDEEIAALIAAMKDENEYVRKSSAEALGGLWQGRGDEELLKLFDHPESGYRLGAAQALAQRIDFTTRNLEMLKYLSSDEPQPTWMRLVAAGLQEKALKSGTMDKIKRLIRDDSQPVWVRLAALEVYSLILDKQQKAEAEAQEEQID